MAADARVYHPVEIVSASSVATGFQVLFFVLLVLAGKSRAVIQAKPEAVTPPIPIAVKPVIDDLPLLKLGSKRVRAKLPDMWKKQAPIKQYEATSAPSPDALKTPEAIPSAPVSDAQAPPPDAEIVKKLDEVLDARADVQAPNLAQPGSPGGVKEGTETDPLKARAVSLYRMKIVAWFNARFRPPLGELTCEVLKPLTASVSVNVGADRTVAGYTMTRPSGNALFDARVKATMDGAMGQQLPPPPPLYPDIVGTAVTTTFSGKHPQCQ